MPAGARALARSGVPTLLVQSADDRVTDARGAAAVAEAFSDDGGSGSDGSDGSSAWGVARLTSVEDVRRPAESRGGAAAASSSSSTSSSPSSPLCLHVELSGGEWGHNLHASSAAPPPEQQQQQQKAALSAGEKKPPAPKNFLQPGYAAAARFLGFA